jgi:hypothetical protein
MTKKCKKIFADMSPWITSRRAPRPKFSGSPISVTRNPGFIRSQTFAKTDQYRRAQINGKKRISNSKSLKKMHYGYDGMPLIHLYLHGTNYISACYFSSQSDFSMTFAGNQWYSFTVTYPTNQFFFKYCRANRFSSIKFHPRTWANLIGWGENHCDIWLVENNHDEIWLVKGILRGSGSLDFESFWSNFIINRYFREIVFP